MDERRPRPSKGQLARGRCIIANFVEQATLVLVDKASKNAARINAELTKLLATANKLKSIKIDIKGLSAATTQTKNLAREMDRAARAAQRIRVPNISGVNVPPVAQSARAAQPRRRTGIVGAGFNGIGVGVGGMSAGGAIATGAALQAGRSAGRAVVASSAERTTQAMLGFTTAELAKLAESAEDASKGMFLVTKTESQAAARNLKNAGASDAALTGLTRTVLESQNMLTSQFGADEAKRITESNIKIADLAGVLDDEKLGAALIRAATSAQLRGGKDFNPKTFLAAVRTSGQAQTLAEQALTEFAANVDEKGQRFGSDLSRTFQVLEATGKPGEGVAAGIVDGLKESGFKDFFEANREAVKADPFAEMRRFFIPLLEGAGVDTRNAVAVDKFLRDQGVIDRKTRQTITTAVTKKRERELDRANAKRVKAEAFEAAARKDIGLAITAVSTQFKDLSATALQPFADKLAPMLTDFAAGLDDLARGDFSKSAIAALATGGVAAAGVVAVQNAPAIALTLAARQHMGAAAALTRAAGSISAGGRGTPAGAATRSARSGRAGRGAVMGGAGSLMFSALDGELTGADWNAAGGAIAGGFIGAPFGPVGVAIGSTAGDYIGRAFGEQIKNFVTTAKGIVVQAGKDAGILANDVKVVMGPTPTGGLGQGPTFGQFFGTSPEAGKPGADIQNIISTQQKITNNLAAEQSRIATAQAKVDAELRAFRNVENADRGPRPVEVAAAGAPIPVTITNQDLTPVATQTPMSVVTAQAMQTQTPGTLERTTQTFLTGMDVNFAEAQTRFATTFATGGAEAGVAVQNGVTTGGTSAGAAMANSIIAAGQQAAAAMAAAINSATARVQVSNTGAGNTIPAGAPSNTGALQPVE